jgi:2,5-furandicarboxylate decarboxylase 1
MDPGPYITAGVVTTIDPDTGVHNCSFQRCWVKGKNRTGVYPGSDSHNWLNISKHWARGDDAPVAVWVGHHPAALIGSQVKLGYPEDHYHSMGGLLGEPLRLTPTETFGESLLVPADAEVVIEGRIPREHYEAEGPFGEYPRYSGPQHPRPVIEVECVTFRRDAFWHDFGIGHLDASIPGTFSAEANIYQLLKKQVPEVLNVRRAPYGHNIYIQVKKVREGIVKNIILGAMLPTITKYIFVFEEDIDIFDDSQILWAFATRTQLDRDLVVVPGSAGSPLDPSSPALGVTAKVGFDCTRPCAPEPGLPPLYSPVLSIPQEVADGVRVEDHVSAAQLGKVVREEVYW